MKRLIQHIIIRLLIIGLLGPMSAYAWSVAVRLGVHEEEQDSQKEFAVFRSEPRLTAGRGTVPYRRPRRARRAQRPVTRVLPPAQAMLPRVVVVWQPSRLGSDDDDPPCL
ncbi:hypothetical protein [Archangium sp.]|uniref:hypothetical protein n=1 Tax=Archangium sp. TaxID=1872627 RepID=UPI002D2FA660|nr:hypothetical protein [Archangium sp.]HYO53002.1 hypothetical protein [Archangium sp.]